MLVAYALGFRALGLGFRAWAWMSLGSFLLFFFQGPLEGTVRIGFRVWRVWVRVLGLFRV